MAEKQTLVDQLTKLDSNICSRNKLQKELNSRKTAITQGTINKSKYDTEHYRRVDKEKKDRKLKAARVDTYADKYALFSQIVCFIIAICIIAFSWTSSFEVLVEGSYADVRIFTIASLIMLTIPVVYFSILMYHSIFYFWVDMSKAAKVVGGIASGFSVFYIATFLLVLNNYNVNIIPIIIYFAIIAVGLLIAFIIAKSEKKIEQYKTRKAYIKIDKEFEPKLREARLLDDKERRRYEEDLAENKRKNSAALSSECKKLESQIKELDNEINSNGIFDVSTLDKEPNLLSEVIYMIKSGKANTVEEAVSRYRENLRVAEEKKKKEEEERKKKEAAEAEERKKREAEEARIRIQLEEERRLNSPGKVTIEVIDGDERSLNGDIWIDGGYYGTVHGYGTVYLNPGLHNINARVKYGSYYLESSPRSFNLIGGSEQPVTFMAVNGRLVCICI